MPLVEEIEEHFGTKNLYEAINVDKDATPEQIKKAYRKTSLLTHPDRVPDSDKEKATKKFQVLAQIHYILSDSEKRSLYDEQGIVADDDTLESQANWEDYWRQLFPKITFNEIQTFMDKYKGSREEEEDLIAAYNKYEGDMDKISELHISYDEEETTEHIKKLIAKGKLKDLPKFSKEPQSKKNKRAKRAQREAKKAEQLKGQDDLSDLTAIIKKRRANINSNFLADLEAKYAPKKKKK